MFARLQILLDFRQSIVDHQTEEKGHEGRPARPFMLLDACRMPSLSTKLTETKGNRPPRRLLSLQDLHLSRIGLRAPRNPFHLWER